MIKRHSILTAILLCFVAFTQVMAQEMQEPEPLPIDPKVRYGKLSNGLTYYIRHNDQLHKYKEYAAPTSAASRLLAGSEPPADAIRVNLCLLCTSDAAYTRPLSDWCVRPPY